MKNKTKYHTVGTVLHTTKTYPLTLTPLAVLQALQ